MNKISKIGSLLKKIYRTYSSELLHALEEKGFYDLRPSFLEVLITICHSDGQSIKHIGEACQLKKQTMTSHLNELERRGYIHRRIDNDDKRIQCIFLSDYGEKFKIALNQSLNDLETKFIEKIGEVQLSRVELLLEQLQDEFLRTFGNKV